MVAVTVGNEPAGNPHLLTFRHTGGFSGQTEEFFRRRIAHLLYTAAVDDDQTVVSQLHKQHLSAVEAGIAVVGKVNAVRVHHHAEQVHIIGFARFGIVGIVERFQGYGIGFFLHDPGFFRSFRIVSVEGNFILIALICSQNVPVGTLNHGISRIPHLLNVGFKLFPGGLADAHHLGGGIFLLESQRFSGKFLRQHAVVVGRDIGQKPSGT